MSRALACRTSYAAVTTSPATGWSAATKVRSPLALTTGLPVAADPLVASG